MKMKGRDPRAMAMSGCLVRSPLTCHSEPRSGEESLTSQ